MYQLVLAASVPNIVNIKLTDRHILHIHDTVTLLDLKRLLDSNGNPAVIIIGNIATWYGNANTVKILGIPIWLEREMSLLTTASVIDQVNTTDCFNFMINKKTINRSLLIKLIEYFKLVSNSYTYSGIGRITDMQNIIDEFIILEKNNKNFLNDDKWDEFKTTMLSPNVLEKKFIKFKNQIITDVSIDNYGGNLYSWEAGIKNIFQNSAVSLITESCTFQLCSTFTEKTAYAIMGLTFPIWIGGYGHAESWKNIGFDTFDDIINHNYQYKSTLIERCYFAFYDNLQLLTDLSYVSALRERYRDRLLTNQKLIVSNQLTKYCQSTVNAWPTELAEFVNMYLPLIHQPDQNSKIKKLLQDRVDFI